MCQKCIDAFNELTPEQHAVFSEENIENMKQTLRDIGKSVVTTHEPVFHEGTTEEEKADHAEAIALFRGAVSMLTLLGYVAYSSKIPPEMLGTMFDGFNTGSNYADYQDQAKKAAPVH